MSRIELGSRERFFIEKNQYTMKKIIGLIFASIALVIFAFQAGSVLAKEGQKDDKPITSPITSPCKPGWGYGDDNHCHFGPPGLTGQHPDNHSQVSQDDSNHGKGHGKND